MKVEDVVAGKQYSCKFTAKNIPVDQFGRPGGMYSMADLPIARIGDYTSTGYITGRDFSTQLCEVQDYTSEKTFVVEFDDVVDIVEVD